MPYLISDKQSDCQGWATVKEESDGSYTTIGCHDNKQDAIDQMVAVSIEEGIEPGGEVSKRALLIITDQHSQKMCQKVEPVATATSTTKPSRMMQAIRLGANFGKILLMALTTATNGKQIQKIVK
jgi:hypothetical protein